MLVLELFDYADHSPKKHIKTKTCYTGQENQLVSAGSQLDEDYKISDILTARELIGQAVKDPSTKHEYFNFLKHLRNKHGAEYSTEIHQEAAKLAANREEKQ